MIDQKYKKMLLSAAKMIFGKREAFQRGAEDAQVGNKKASPYLSNDDQADYENGYDTAFAAKEELEQFIKEKSK